MNQETESEKRNIKLLNYLQWPITGMARMIVNITNGEEEYPFLFNFINTKSTSDKNENRNKIFGLFNNILNLLLSMIFYIMVIVCYLLISVSTKYIVLTAFHIVCNRLNQVNNPITEIGWLVSFIGVEIIGIIFGIIACKNSIRLIYNRSKHKILGIIMFIALICIGLVVDLFALSCTFRPQDRFYIYNSTILNLEIYPIIEFLVMFKILYDIYQNKAGKRKIYEYIIGAYSIIIAVTYIIIWISVF
ncbi:hypothetical protein NEIRO03_2240 [Nematocida sp. AWRm78]|nr:hypothetical protein NEIRO03_2240 [Nematocida sp. AWRm78]